MSTATVPATLEWVADQRGPERGRHVMRTLRHTWVCYQVNCNGVNHYWRCGR